MRKTLEYKGAEVVYSHTDGEQTLVLLHGFLEDRAMWLGFTEKLRAEFRVICPDLLGHGESGNVGYVHSMEDQAGMVAAILKKENVTRCTIVGHSMGGYVALALAEEHPELIRGLALFHSTAYPDSEERIKGRERVIELVMRNKRIYLQALIPGLFADATRPQFTDIINQLVDRADAYSVQGIIANVRGMIARSDRSHVLKDGGFKKLIIHGLMDAVIPTEDVLKQSVLNSNISLLTIEGIGHMGHLEAPDECLSAITEFCRN